MHIKMCAKSITIFIFPKKEGCFSSLILGYKFKSIAIRTFEENPDAFFQEVSFQISGVFTLIQLQFSILLSLKRCEGVIINEA